MSQTQQSGAVDPARVFPGPRPFESIDQAHFFGRTEESTALRDLVGAYRDVLLYAPSGIGKTSLVNAGLIPRLLADDFTVISTRVGGAEARGQPESASYLSALLRNACDAKSGAHVEAPSSLVDLVANKGPRGTVLIIDQFEEIFLGSIATSAARREFFDQLDSALKSAEDFRLLVVMREEYLASIEEYSGSVPNEFEIRYQLRALSPEAARLAIRGPLQAAKIPIADHVVEDIVTMLRRGPAGTAPADTVEPLHLQLVCRTIVAQLRDGEEITSAHVAASGDVEQVLTSFYEQQVRAASAHLRVTEALLRRWFDQELTTPTGARGVTRVGRGIASLELIRFFQDQHLIRADARAGAIWYELTHDRLVGPIRKANRDWFERRRARSLVWKLTGAGVLAALSLGAAALVSWRAGQEVDASEAGLTKINVVSSYLASRALEDGRLSDAIQNANNCVRTFRRAADYEQQKLEYAHQPLLPVGTVTPEQKRSIMARGTLNDCALCYYLLGRAEEAMGHPQPAREAYQHAKRYTYARTWDPKGWFWSPSDAAQKGLNRQYSAPVRLSPIPLP
jgi:hypothetical protein